MPRTQYCSKKSRQSTLKRWKTYNEKEILESFFQLDQDWNRKTILYVKDLVNLTEEQIYKWGYEKKKKLTVTKIDVQRNASDLRNSGTSNGIENFSE
jgi:hypothetical protein